MAKKSASTIQVEQWEVPEQFREAVRISEDGTQVFVTFSLPRFVKIAVRKNSVVEVDRARIAGSSRLSAVYLYGEGRKFRDGAPVKLIEKDAENNVVETPMSDAQKVEFAISHAEMRREWLYGEREQQTRSGVDTETQECRKAVVQYLIGKKIFTAKTLPSAVAKAASVPDIMSAAKENGVSAKALAALIKRGRAIAAIRDEEINFDLD